MQNFLIRFQCLATSAAITIYDYKQKTAWINFLMHRVDSKFTFSDGSR